MATWRKRDLDKRSRGRSGRLARLFQPATLLVLLALVLSGVALWQALDAQSRAALITHDVGLATNRLRGLDASEPVMVAPGGAAPSASPAQP